MQSLTNLKKFAFLRFLIASWNGNIRDGRPPIIPGYASSIFKYPNEKGFLARSGFYYKCYVPKDTNLAEQRFIILAWPIYLGASGINTYFTDQSGEVYVWARGDRKFGGEDAPTLDDVFFGDLWVTPINDLNWIMGN